MNPSALFLALLLLIVLILLAIKWQETRELKRTLSAVFHRIARACGCLFLKTLKEK